MAYLKRFTTRIECECDGSGPCIGSETRLYRLGNAGNLILCKPCFEHELKEGKSSQVWEKAEVYKQNIGGE